MIDHVWKWLMMICTLWDAPRQRRQQFVDVVLSWRMMWFVQFVENFRIQPAQVEQLCEFATRHTFSVNRILTHVTQMFASNRQNVTNHHNYDELRAWSLLRERQMVDVHVEEGQRGNLFIGNLFAYNESSVCVCLWVSECPSGFKQWRTLINMYVANGIDEWQPLEEGKLLQLMEIPNQ